MIADMTLSVVTGANRGIGLAMTRLLKERGHTVVAACRKESPELSALGMEVVTGVDVATDAGIARLVLAVGSRSIDLLVNNASILAPLVTVWSGRRGPLYASDAFHSNRRSCAGSRPAPMRSIASFASRST